MLVKRELRSKLSIWNPESCDLLILIVVPQCVIIIASKGTEEARPKCHLNKLKKCQISWVFYFLQGIKKWPFHH